jgi:Ca-activated chloride channel family protein
VAARPSASPAEVLARADAGLGSRIVQLVQRGGGEGPAHSLAPYFVVAGEGDTERLPLEETRADVQVAGVIARVKVTQAFRNSGKRPIEAVYVFPASTRAAVHGMRLRIGERTVEARIARRDDARRDYAQARQDGKRAALLEEQRPNVFTMSVANVMPGDRIVAELDYSELVVPEDGVYELVYPAVVGPRYGGGADPARDGWLANPYFRAGEAAPYRFGFTAHLETPIGLKEVSSPSHALSVSYRSPSSADVTLAAPGGGDRDVVLRWRLAGDRIESGVLVARDEDGSGGWFLAMIEPPARVAASEMPPREYVFVLDVSGSMHGFPLDTAKALMRALLPRLRPQDTFNVVFFSGGSWVLSPGGSLPATSENVRRALDAFESERGSGGTEIMQALETAYRLPRAGARVSRSVVVVTDGYVPVEARAFKFVREHLDEAGCFAFGIGSSVNRALIEGLARAGQGEPFVVLSPEKAEGAAGKLQRLIETPVLAGIRWSADGLEARDVAPSKLPDLLAERPVVLLGRFKGAPRGRISITGETARGPYQATLEVRGEAARPENAPLRVLWARKWVEILEDEQALAPAKEIEDAVADLGLAHRILTPWTSFVAVDSEVVNRGGDLAAVKQPLPLPHGVSDLAVGGSAPPQLARSGGFVAAQAPVAVESHSARKAEAKVAAEAPRSLGRAEAMPAATDRSMPQRDRAAAVEISGEQVVDLIGATSLREAVRTALARASASGKLRGAVTVRLTIDGSGAVARVEVLAAPDTATRAAVEAALRSVTSAARPSGAGPATYRFEARF